MHCGHKCPNLMMVEIYQNKLSVNFPIDAQKKKFFMKNQIFDKNRNYAKLLQSKRTNRYAYFFKKRTLKKLSLVVPLVDNFRKFPKKSQNVTIYTFRLYLIFYSA